MKHTATYTVTLEGFRPFTGSWKKIEERDIEHTLSNGLDEAQLILAAQTEDVDESELAAAYDLLEDDYCFPDASMLWDYDGAGDDCSRYRWTVRLWKLGKVNVRRKGPAECTERLNTRAY